MIRALYSAGSGMTAQQMSIDNIANNLSNASTTGFKARRPQFQDLLYQNFLQPGAAAGSQTVVPSGLQLGLGTRPTANTIIQTQGSLTETDNTLDIAINGKGFFQVQQPDGTTAYTRSGNFQLNANGNIVDANGNPLIPQITIPAQAQTVTIATDGTISYTQPGQTAATIAGQIQLATFVNPGGLNSVGNGLFLPTDASGQPITGAPGGADGLGTLQQGYLESSNVSIVQEFVNMIIAQRGYEANTKVVKAADEMYQQVNNVTQ
ncbi:MAG TPA: flagellar basal-body rod protein FlgG [Bryobacteraceae bacterium]|nr:flagellar basal-body rod protein FlgG [Bryobacteraceae bacterium]